MDRTIFRCHETQSRLGRSLHALKLGSAPFLRISTFAMPDT